jgi:hypothetical protein
MKLDPDMHIGMHLVSFGKSGVTEVDQVCYEGRTMGLLDQSSTFLTVTVPVDPRVPEF